MMIYIVLSLVAFCSSVQCSKTIIAGTSSLSQLPGQRQQFPSFLSRKGNNEQNSSKAPSEEIDPHYETHYIAQYLDHFDVREERFFRQRYLLSRAYWGSPVQPFKYTNVGYCPGPILFYTGNESPVTAYWGASGFITKRLAQAWGALVVFAEHRYFGKSIPQMFENPWEPDAIKYLSPEQALADYAHLITDLKERLNVSFCPVLSFGGSYGGMLTAWFRGKYPHIVLGGLAASAPFGFVKTTSFNPYSFMDAAQETIKNAGGVTQSNPSLTCDIMMKNEFQRILTESQTKDGALRLSKEFELCEPLSGPDVGLQFVSYIQNALVTATMLDYPYSVDYGIPLPGHPVNRICEDTKTFGLGPSLKKNFWDLENKKKCLDVARDVPDFDAGQGWNYLACSEVYMPIAQRGMWIPETKWNVLNDIDACRQTFNITLRPESITERYFSGFNFVTGASRIIFSNGLLDPWHAMGVLISLSDSLIAIVMPNGAHHLDLREDNKEDPEDVKEARAQEQKIMESWLHDYYYRIRKED